MANANLTVQRGKELLNYDEQTGIFVRRTAPNNSTKVGAIAGTDTNCGYRAIVIDGKQYLAHRLGWLYVTGKWPQNQIDHINGRRSDNRFSNLRDVTCSVNGQNQRRPHSPGGTLGTYLEPRCHNRWTARICVDGVQMYLGMFATAEIAHAAYLAAKRKHHPGCTI